MRKREFLAGLDLVWDWLPARVLPREPMTIYTARILVPHPGKEKGCAPSQDHHGNLSRCRTAIPNGIAVVAEGIWVGEQKAQGYGKTGTHITEDAWLFDWNGKLLKTVHTPSSNTSGFAFGDGHVWMGANGGQEGIYEVDMNSTLVSHRQIPLGPADNGGGCHGLMWHDGKLWIVANRLRGIHTRRSSHLDAGIHHSHHHRSLAWHRLG